MAQERIDDAYLRGFFGISSGPEGDQELAELRSKLTRIKYQNGQDICTIGSVGDCMFFLESGTAVVLDLDGQQINMLHEGEYFGEYGVLSGDRRLSTVRAYGTVIVYRLEAADMMEILRRHPAVYGDMMKRVYAKVTQKHRELIQLTRLHRGILQHPKNQQLQSPRRILIRFGVLAAIFLLSYLFVPVGTSAPVFLLPLILMLVYALLTRRTLESLIVAAMYAAFLFWRSEVSVSFTDSLIEMVCDADNAVTILILSMMGAFVTLIEASGAVTAFKKIVDRRAESARDVRFSLFGIMLVTSIDDCLNFLCGASSTNDAAEAHRVSCEDRALMLSFLPTVFCSFIPISLWGIFVTSYLTPNVNRAGLSLFVRSIPFNFYSIVAVIAMLLLCLDKLPLSRQMQQARRRVKDGGALWPEGSERFLTADDSLVWGRLWNLLLPVAFFVIASLTLRSICSHGFVVDSAVGLVATLIFMFVLYCAQGLMSPEQFAEHLISGIQSMVLPNVLYLLSICFATLLNDQAMGETFDDLMVMLQPASPLLPAGLFILSLLFSIALGSSWGMYAVAFPVAIRMAVTVGIRLPLCIGAVIAAGIAGEMCSVFSSDNASVGEAIGCNPEAVVKVRLPYGIIFALIALLLYIPAGFLFR